MPDINTQPEAQAPATPQASLKKAPVENKQATWAKIEAVYTAAKTAYLTKGATLVNVLDSLTATLTDIKNAETQGMGGLGQGQPEMELPATPAPEEAPAA
ncbi:MAG: hypothetical protein PHQ59_01875 [Candidatus Daviesbacteria bacterium]|nr:hypothetical protein [Candidatus Daviesbacteria bacterium]